jgi:hypothetical protein
MQRVHNPLPFHSKLRVLARLVPMEEIVAIPELLLFGLRQANGVPIVVRFNA